MTELLQDSYWPCPMLLIDLVIRHLGRLIRLFRPVHVLRRHVGAFLVWVVSLDRSRDRNLGFLLAGSHGWNGPRYKVTCTHLVWYRSATGHVIEIRSTGLLLASLTGLITCSRTSPDGAIKGTRERHVTRQFFTIS